MDAYASSSLQQFKNLVAIRFQLYNSLFTSLPFHRIERTGVLLSLFLIHCEEGFKKNQSPAEIIDSFLSQYTAYNQQEALDLLFRFVQYTERQVVLFDALEDAAFTQVNDMNGPGTLKQLQSVINSADKEKALEGKLENFSVRLVLTAHPTQFYPGEVLGIIHDLSKALMNENAALINSYLQQLGKTPFLRKQKPTPFDEAMSLIWYLENVFYAASGKIISSLKALFPHAVNENNPIIRMGFWPGGDRDGNPFVKADITIQVATALREAIIKSYYLDVRRIKRRLTFKGVESVIQELEKKLYSSLIAPAETSLLDKNEMLMKLRQVRQVIINEHNGLFLHALDNLISKIETFGLYFASLDVRQDSSIHEKTLQSIAELSDSLPENYDSLSEKDKGNLLLNITQPVDKSILTDDVQRDTIEGMQAIKTIQQNNGEEACNRYIISHTTSALSLLEVYGLFLLSGWKKEELTVDIVPLFETIDDLQAAASIMESLYRNEPYRQHLQKRKNTQTIMLGFSDGTKDGGYLMANYSIYKAKEELTTISKQHDISVVFFDGRGGPPARGGGKTHRFYASMGHNISNQEIQLTVQGQTVSSNFGTVDTAQFNIEQLVNAGISNDLLANRKATLTKEEEALLLQLSEIGYDAYTKLKNHPYFIDYLVHVSPLRYYAETNIGSRPAKRGGSSKISLNDLRAIPYVGAWSQTKQNLTGYYGVGTALKAMEERGQWKEVQHLYKSSLFFRTLIDNCEMAMKKCFFPLTAFLSKHPKYGEVWRMTYNEFELTVKCVLRLSGNTELMADYPVEQLSIQMRERIVLPLAAIQQYCLSKLRDSEEKGSSLPLKDVYEKLVIRCSFGIINAARNSV